MPAGKDWLQDRKNNHINLWSVWRQHQRKQSAANIQYAENMPIHLNIKTESPNDYL